MMVVNVYNFPALDLKYFIGIFWFSCWDLVLQQPHEVSSILMSIFMDKETESQTLREIQ
jgi:hypothetical protein